MSTITAYEPKFGYKYQLLCRLGRVWEHCDYAKDEQERDYLMGEYRMAYGAGWEFLALKLPKKYWEEV